MDEPVSPRVVSRRSIATLRRMSRSRVRLRDGLLCGPIVLGLAALAYLRLTAPPPSISLSAYDRVETGMSQGEVEQVVGTRPGAYGMFWGPGSERRQAWTEPARWVYWNDAHGVLGVGLDVQGRVCAKRLEYHPGGATDDPKSWPWWKRLVNRSVPGQAPYAMYSPF